MDLVSIMIVSIMSMGQLRGQLRNTAHMQVSDLSCTCVVADVVYYSRFNIVTSTPGGGGGGYHVDMVYIYICACLLGCFFAKFGIAIGGF